MHRATRTLLTAAAVAAVLGASASSALAASGPAVTEFSVAPATPCTVAHDPATGDVYFDSPLELTGRSLGGIGVLDPRTGTVRTFPLPNPLATPGGLTFGPNGELYFTEYGAGNAIGQLDPATGAITEYLLPTPLSEPTSIALGPDGGLWFIANGTQQLVRFDPVTHAFTAYALPSPGANLGFEIIERGAGDELLFSLPDTNQIGTFDISTHRFATYTAPTPLSLPQGVAWADGAIWFTETLAQKLARVDPATGHVTEFPLAVGDLSDLTLLAPFPGSIVAAANGDLYIADGATFGGDSIIQFDPATDAKSVIRTPTLASGPCDWDVASTGTTLWFGEFSGGKIGRLTIPAA